MNLNGRVAVVTGGGRGIGREYCEALAARGASVVAADIDVTSAEETAELVAKNGGESPAVAVDLSDRDSTVGLPEEVGAGFGRAGILPKHPAVSHPLRPRPHPPPH